MQPIHIELTFVDYHNKDNHYCDLLPIIESKSMHICFVL